LTDLQNLAKDASPVSSGSVSDMMTKVLYRNPNIKYENITGSVGVNYEAYWVEPRHGEGLLPIEEMVDSATNAVTGTQDGWVSSSALSFTRAALSDLDVAGSLVNFGKSSTPVYNPFAFRTLIANYKIVKSVKGLIHPGKAVSFDLTMKPCAYNATDLNVMNSNGCFIQKKYYTGLIIKWTGDLSYTDVTHYVAEHGVHLQALVTGSRILKQLAPNMQNIPFTGYHRVGFQSAAGGSDNGGIVINDESDAVGYAVALDTNANTY